MHNAEELRARLIEAFPLLEFSGNAAPHDCADCSIIRTQLANISWWEVPTDFVRDHDCDLPLLTHAAYVHFLPAWLREAIQTPDGEVASMLMVNLQDPSNVSGFSSSQRWVIVHICKFIAQNNGFPPDDPVDIERLAEIERVWGQRAA